MRKFDKYFNSFWVQEDNFTNAIYGQFISMIWNPSEIFIREDISQWRHIDSKTRDVITEGLMMYSTIIQLVALEAIPKIISGMDDSFISRQALLSAIQARLTGPHTIVTSRMVRDMNSDFLVERLQDNISDRDGIRDITSNLHTVFNSLQGWALAYNATGETSDMDGLSVYEELTFRLWQTCSISAVLIETASSLPISVLFSEMEKGRDMPEILKAIQVISKDTTTISTYLCKLAALQMNSLPKERQEEAKAWLNDFIIEMYEVLWKGIYSDLEIESTHATITLLELNQYNINKVLTKMKLKPMYHTTDMPKIVEKYMGVVSDTSTLSAYKKKHNWLKWRSLD